MLKTIMSEKNLYENEDPTWQIHMRTLTQRKRSLQIAQIIDEELHQYYVVERGQKVPNWSYIKDQDWWIEYLKSLGIDPRNP
jgi:hypothetical protein